MTHKYQRESWVKEAALTTVSGLVFGATSIAVGHPFDSVKTKMQAETTYLESPKFRTTTLRIFQNEGIVGFWRGWLPPLLASSIFRSLQFSFFEMAFTALGKSKHKTWADKNFLYIFPWTYRVFLGGVSGGTARMLIECASENMKVKRQTNQKIDFKGLYRGAGVQWVTTVGMFTTFMVICDWCRRNTKLMDTVTGQFAIGATAGTICWYVVWPFEMVKNQIQAETTGIGNTIMDRWRFSIRQAGGVRGLFRGFVPGTLCYFMRNGSSMVAMSMVNDLFFKMGWRKK